VIYNKLDSTEKAMEAYDYALAINSQNSFALFNKGNILSGLDRFREAIPVYHEYLENEPDSFEAMTYLAECYDKSGDLTLARKYYHDAIDIAPEYADPWFGLGVIEYNLGNYDEALVFFRKSVRLDDENPEFWYLLGKAHYGNGEIKDALRCYREAIKLDGYYNEVWADLGMIIFEQKFTVKAIPYLEQALKITGDVPGINYLLAMCYLHAGKNEKAYYQLSIALETDPELFNDFKAYLPRRITGVKITRLLETHGLL
jgi:tetratricopeptide (TPR) repeat protein